MRRFYYRHSRGVTEVVVGRGLPYGSWARRRWSWSKKGFGPLSRECPLSSLGAGRR